MDALSLILGLVVSATRTIYSHFTLSSYVRVSLLSLLATRVYAFFLASITLYAILESDLYPYLNVLLLFNAISLCLLQFQVSQFLFSLLCTISWYGILEISLTAIARQNIKLGVLLSAMALGITPAFRSLVGNNWQMRSVYFWLLGFHILASFFWFYHFPTCLNDPDNNVCIRFRLSDTLAPWSEYSGQVGLLLFAATIQAFCFYFVSSTSQSNSDIHSSEDTHKFSMISQLNQELHLIGESACRILERSIAQSIAVSVWLASFTQRSLATEPEHDKGKDTLDTLKDTLDTLAAVSHSRSPQPCCSTSSDSSSISEEEALLLVQRGLLLSKTRRAI